MWWQCRGSGSLLVRYIWSAPRSRFACGAPPPGKAQALVVVVETTHREARADPWPTGGRQQPPGGLTASRLLDQHRDQASGGHGRRLLRVSGQDPA